jgi:hypothetical protein
MGIILLNFSSSTKLKWYDECKTQSMFDMQKLFSNFKTTVTWDFSENRVPRPDGFFSWRQVLQTEAGLLTLNV